MLGPMAMLAVYVATALGQKWFVSRGTNENIALILLSVPLLGFTFRAIAFRSEFHLFMAVLCAAFFCREWHFAGTSKGIYVMLGLLAFWAVKRKTELEGIIGEGPAKVWVWSTFATYVLSQLIARRFFRYVYLPQETELHILLEESVETMAHLAMIVTCLVTWKIKPAAAKEQPEKKP
ncbi:MAG: hypothetical protein J7M40_08920 [Planctomycetes bacterium]|nr:hypothetical protein [Planctomycetota bacterium]